MKSTIAILCIFSLSLQSFSADQRASASLVAPEASSHPRATTTPEQRQRVVRVTRALESVPFGETATANREWALSLIDHAPDIFPLIRARMFSDVADAPVPDRRPLYAQFVFGFVTFQLENPDRAGDGAAVYHAGLASCLHVYRTALERDSSNRIKFLDVANEQERGGTLQQYVERLVAEQLPEARGK